MQLNIALLIDVLLISNLYDIYKKTGCSSFVLRFLDTAPQI